MQWLAKKVVKKATGSHDATRNHINHQCHLLIDSDRSADVYHLILGGFDRRDLDSAPIAEAKCACLPIGIAHIRHHRIWCSQQVAGKPPWH